MVKEEENLMLEKLSYLKEVLLKLKVRYNKYLKETNEEERETLFAAMSKYTEKIVESAIKINNKLLEINKDFASSYYDTFMKLSKYYTIDKDVLKKLAKTTGLRNRISHEYDKIDTDITINSFKNILSVYEKYVNIIIDIIKK